MTALLHAAAVIASLLAVWVLGSLGMLGLWILIVEIGGTIGDDEPDA